MAALAAAIAAPAAPSLFEPIQSSVRPEALALRAAAIAPAWALRVSTVIW